LIQDVPYLHSGQVVYISGVKTSPLNWPFGRVVSLNTGKDGVSRVANLKKEAGTLTIPVNKLISQPFKS
jgi:hypothetical protein